MSKLISRLQLCGAVESATFSHLPSQKHLTHQLAEYYIANTLAQLLARHVPENSKKSLLSFTCCLILAFDHHLVLLNFMVVVIQKRCHCVGKGKKPSENLQ